MKVWNKFYRNILIMLSGNVAASFIAVVALPVLTRFFTPDDFGLYQLFLSLIAILSMLATGRYELAIIAPRYNFVANILVIETVILSAIISFFLSIGCIFLTEHVEFFKSMYFSGFPIWVGSYTFLVCVYQILYNWFVRQACYKLTMVSNIIYTIGCIFIPLVCFFLNITNGLIIGMIISKFISILYLLYFYKKSGFSIKHSFSLRFYIRILIRYKDFIRYALPGNLLDVLAVNAPAFLLNYFYGVTVTGYYSMTTRCISLPVSLAAKSIGDVFKQEASKTYNRQRECYAIYQQVMQMMIKGSIVYALLIITLAPIAFSVILGEQWRSAGEYAQLLVLAGGSSLVYSSLCSIYLFAVRVREYLILQVFSLMLVTIILYLGGCLLSVEYTLFIYSIGIALVNVIGMVIGKKIAKGEI